MERLGWGVTKFQHIISYPSDISAKGVDVYPQDMVNLRVDRWGHLRLRPIIQGFEMLSVGDLAPIGVHITGVAASADKLFWLRSDGKLFVIDGLPGDPIEITGVENLEGRISVVAAFETFVILTSEGTDHGYVISLETNEAEPLGITFEEISGLGGITHISRVRADGELDSGVFYYYKFSFVRDGIVGEEESQLSVGRIAVNITGASATNVLSFDDFPAVSTDYNVRGMNVYRALGSYVNGQVQVDDSRYYRVGFWENSANLGMLDDLTFSDDGTVALTVNVPENTFLPETVSQLEVFNGRLFVPDGDELRYSDVRVGEPVWFAFPARKSIRTGTRIDFCAAYRGLLLFGGEDGLYRLTGDSEYNFDHDRISARGPVSSDAWAVLDKFFGFVGVDGLYLTDGTEAPEIAPQLDGFFNRYRVEDGIVGELPNKVSFWGVRRRSADDETDTVFFVSKENDWTRLDGTTIEQYVSVNLDGEGMRGIVADGHRAPRILDWVVSDDTEDAVLTYSSGNMTMTTHEDIDWVWESQQLAWDSRGLGAEMKSFRELRISGEADSPVTCTFYFDNATPFVETVTLDRLGDARLDPYRIRLGHRAFACRFKLSGDGNVLIRALALEVWV